MLNELIAIIVIVISAIMYFVAGRNTPTRMKRPGIGGNTLVGQPMEFVAPTPPVANTPMANTPAIITLEANIPQDIPTGMSKGVSLSMPIDKIDGTRSCLRQTPWVFDKSKYPRKKILRANDATEDRVRVAKTNKRVTFADRRLERHITGGRIKEFYSQV